MAGTSAPSVPRAGLRNTLRFQLKDPAMDMMEREVFARVVLLDKMKLKVEDVYCLQTNRQEKCFDVTVNTGELCKAVLEKFERMDKVGLVGRFNVISLDRPNFRVITVHMYNPYVTDEALVAFLAKFAEVLTPARYVRDSVGLWTGKRQFQVLLRTEKNGLEGLMHPPAQFNIGADKGYLFYSRQPPFCRRCRRYGHNDGGCEEQRCLQCAQLGHIAKECTVPKSCHSCGSLDHLMRDCKGGRKQYREGVRGEEGMKDRRLGEESQKRIIEQQVTEKGMIEPGEEMGAAGMERGKETEEVEDVMAAFLEALSGEQFKSPMQCADGVEEEMEEESKSDSANARESQLVRKTEKRKGRPSKKRKPETVLKMSFSEESSSTDSQDGLEMDNARPLFQLTEEMVGRGNEEREEESYGLKSTPVRWADLGVSESEATSLEGQEMGGTLKNE
ncbi:uncharacterized protein LOC128011245 [Carassius gibelio]|uniref:uncharacterized protein LOC128011245 n=1 Tax=Carassius gibelio TaxID=101364 RepID=UPI001633B08D|nr:uncharacterized protein LOC128011245 [Carassius gibelio]